ncbi:unnamed protein product [Bursaphelenchus xylophilus]|uniref:(pine wood nematode) hypothetical protein n=1 Tax=Bursaphelenchus xylophilus TaxID=6326 RepID=A0A7I8WGV3_BURXY|nr:unnamed protein product [Bursaphelenchus xylophilus]CAG9110827.1 unnamed protein product [Bursaphelenchus xylophilus]
MLKLLGILLSITCILTSNAQQYGPILPPQPPPNSPLLPPNGQVNNQRQNGNFGNVQNGQFGRNQNNVQRPLFGQNPNVQAQNQRIINPQQLNQVNPGQGNAFGSANQQSGGVFGQQQPTAQRGLPQSQLGLQSQQGQLGQAGQQGQLGLQGQRQSQPLLRPGVMYDRVSNSGQSQFGGSIVSASNSPGIFINPTRQGSRLSAGAVLNLQLTGYINENKAMRDGKTCYCPREECTLLENVLHPCYFTFTIIISPNGDEPVQYISKQFVIVNSTGMPEQSGDWMSPVSVQTAFKPAVIDVFVNNLGPVIQGRTVVALNEFWLVDSFTVELDDYKPTIANQQPTPVVKRLTGSVVRSQLEFHYSVQCQAGYVGDNCDLQCRPTNTGPARAICTSRLTNISSVCTYDQSRTAVENCTQCGLGLMNDDCADLAGITQRERGVSQAYKVWTIILGVLCGLLFICLLILLLLYVCALRRRKNGDTRERQRIYQQQQRPARPIVSNPLLQDEWNKPREPYALRQAAPLVDSESIQSDTARQGGVSYNPAPRREAQV